MHYLLDDNLMLPKQGHAPTPSFTHNMLCHTTSRRKAPLSG